MAVRKKDGSIRLYYHHRKLNAKTIPDRHPLPRIQNIVDNLGGNQCFTLFYQSKAYHQLHLQHQLEENQQYSSRHGVFMNGLESHLD